MKVEIHRNPWVTTGLTGYHMASAHSGGVVVSSVELTCSDHGFSSPNRASIGRPLGFFADTRSREDPANFPFSIRSGQPTQGEANLPR